MPRAGAIFIDWLIIFIPSLVLGILQATTHSVVFQVLDYVWEFGMWSWFSVQVGMTGSSPGMRVVGLRCVRSSTGQLIGGGLGFLRGLLNLILFILCVVPGVVSFLWPLWDSQRQTLPDKIVGTLVYRVQPEGFSLFPKRTAA